MSEEGEEIEIVVKEKIKKVVNLELGDIIKIESEGNNEYHLKTFLQKNCLGKLGLIRQTHEKFVFLKTSFNLKFYFKKLF